MTTAATVNRRLSSTLDRLARATSIIRVRENDITRDEANGGSLSELLQRADKAVSELERVADSFACFADGHGSTGKGQARSGKT